MSKRLSFLVKSLRVATYLGVVAAGLSVVGVRAVHAKTANAALAIGEPLGRLEVSTEGGSTLTFNGQRLRVSAARVDAGVRETLDRLQKACETHADGLADDLASIDDGFAKSAPSTRGFPGIAILRDERDGRGVVACFATGEHTSAAGVARRLARFSKTQVLSDLGALRYVAVHAEEGGGSKVVATWSDDRLALGELFPASGDAPGTDPTAAPRPADARRLVSVRVEPAPYGAFVYASSVSPESALAAYEAALVSRGFRPVPPADAAGDDRRSRAYQGALVDVLVTAQAGAEGTTLSVIESRYATAAAEGSAK